MNENAAWVALVDEYEQAKARKHAIWPIVFRKFSAIGEGVSSSNPTQDELDEFDAACDRVRDLERVMRDFCRASA